MTTTQDLHDQYRQALANQDTAARLAAFTLLHFNITIATRYAEEAEQYGQEAGRLALQLSKEQP